MNPGTDPAPWSRGWHGALAAALALGLLGGTPARSKAQPVDDAQFLATFSREYEQIRGMAPDLVVLELRDRVELVASRGSQVGAASNERRVRGFETALLQGLQSALCKGAPAPAGRPSSAVVESVNLAASSQGLRTRGADVAELSALAHRLIDSQARPRWCALRSLDEVR